MDIKNLEKNIQAEVDEAIRSEENTIPYIPMTNLPTLNTVIPLALASETILAQFKFKEEHPDVIAYLLEKLKYKSKLELSYALLSEQADAVAMAIYQIEKGNGFILSDMAGIGKGRVNASILRFAYQNDYLPVFITCTTSLFSAIYRDIVDIGGLGEKNGKPYYGNPFILNGFESGGKEIIEKEDGTVIKIQRPSPSSIIDANNNEIYKAPDQKEITKIVASRELPSKYDYMLLTYSQLGSPDLIEKLYFLQDVFTKRNYKVVLALDEVHKASGDSVTGRNVQNLLSLSKGCLFSSATFSKRPENMFLYGVKTDLKKAPVSTKNLIKSISKGGDKLTEYLASCLVESQQMLRRQRTFGNCKVIYEYMKTDIEKLYKKYDDTIALYNEVLDFFTEKNNPNCSYAINQLAKRFAQEKKVELAPIFDPRRYKSIKEWELANIGKYQISRNYIGNVSRSQFNFIETLLFSLKTEFVADITIQQLTNKDLLNYTVDGLKEFKSNRKPIVTVKNTLQGVFSKLGIKIGDIIDKADFSLFILSLLKSGIGGSLELTQITDGGKPKKIKGDVELRETDYKDGGKMYRDLLEKLNNTNLGIPLSPIDDLIDKLEAVPRQNWDREFNNNSTYVVGEITGRTLRLKQLKDGRFQLISNNKDKSTSESFKKFNNGIYDILLINVVGSTGEDAHSSPKFKDKRPRVMVVNQVELDVAVEVQKRGRINRTGQLNYPTYIYAVSNLPTETRRLVMLANKLKSLDANTTGNQKQSERLSEIRDSNDNVIQDIANEIGDELLKEFLQSPDNTDYAPYSPSLEQMRQSSGSGESIVTIFMRNLELATANLQLSFYNSINQQYINRVEQLKLEDNYNLETVIKDLKGQVINRLPLFIGDNTSPFNQDVYIEDIYGNLLDKPFSKDEKEALINKLAENQDPNTYMNNFIYEMRSYLKDTLLPEIASKVKEPNYDLYLTQEERDDAKKEYELKIERAKFEKEKQYDFNIERLIKFKPNSKVLIPDDFEELKEENARPSKYNRGVFCGIKLIKGSVDKYASGNILLVFCQLSGKPKVEINLAKNGLLVLFWIVKKLQDLTIVDIQTIDAWVIDKGKRGFLRMITGEIISGYKFANEMIQNNDDLNKTIKFVKFTTVNDGEVRLGLQLKFKERYQPLQIRNHKIYYKINDVNFLNAIQNLSQQREYYMLNSENNFRIKYQRFSNGDIILYVQLFLGKGKRLKYELKSARKPDVIEEINKYYQTYNTVTDFYASGVQTKQIIDIVEFKVDVIPNNNEWKNNLLKIFHLIDKYDVFTVTISDSKIQNTIIDAPIIKLEPNDSEKNTDMGIYDYALLMPYNSIKEKVDGFSKIKSIDVNKGKYGVAIVSPRANPLECSAYSLMPLNVEPIKLIKDSFGLLKDATRLNFSNALKKAFEDNVENYEIFSIIEETFYGVVLKLENIFGLYAKDTDELVDLYRKYYEGKIEEIEIPKDFDLEAADKNEELLTVDYTTIEDFIILFKTKIR